MPLVLGIKPRTSYDNWKELTLKPIDFIRFGLYLTDQLEVYALHYLGGATIAITSYIGIIPLHIFTYML